MTRAVSPKKIGERKKGNVPSSGTPRRREDSENGQRGSKSVTVAPWKSPMMAWSAVLPRLLPGGRPTGTYCGRFRARVHTPLHSHVRAECKLLHTP
jgi:hypothetical protein